MAEEVGVILKAIDQFSGTLNLMKKQLDDLADAQRQGQEKMKSGFTDLKSAAMSLLPAFSALAVVNWTKNAIMEAEKYNEALRRLGVAVTGTGANFAARKADIVKWADAIRETTRFTDDQAIASLETLARKTGDVTTAQKLTQLAMDVSVATGKDLSTITNQLGLAYQGNQRGLVGLQREFGAVLKDAKDGTQIFAKLTSLYGGMSQQENSLTSESKKLKNQWEELTKQIGGGLTPAAQGMMTVLSAGLNGFVTVFKFVKTIVEELGIAIVGFGHLVATIFAEELAIAGRVWTAIKEIIVKVLSGDFTGAFNTFKTSSAAVWAQIKNGAQNVKDSVKDTAADMKLSWDTNLTEVIALWKAHETGVAAIIKDIGGIKAQATRQELDDEKAAYEKFRTDIGGILSSNIEKNIKAQAGFGDTMKGIFDDMVGYAQKKLAELAVNKVFDILTGILTGGALGGEETGGSKKGLFGMGGFLGIFASGGYIKDDGMAKLHKGEYVVPASQVNSNHQVNNNSTVAPTINIHGYQGSPEQLAEEIGLRLQKMVRGQGQTGMTPV